jgi:hypothetical protein
MKYLRLCVLLIIGSSALTRGITFTDKDKIHRKSVTFSSLTIQYTTYSKEDYLICGPHNIRKLKVIPNQSKYNCNIWVYGASSLMIVLNRIMLEFKKDIQVIRLTLSDGGSVSITLEESKLKELFDFSRTYSHQGVISRIFYIYEGGQADSRLLTTTTNKQLWESYQNIPSEFVLEWLEIRDTHMFIIFTALNPDYVNRSGQHCYESVSPDGTKQYTCNILWTLVDSLKFIVMERLFGKSSNTGNGVILYQVTFRTTFGHFELGYLSNINTEYLTYIQKVNRKVQVFDDHNHEFGVEKFEKLGRKDSFLKENIFINNY